MASLNDEFLLIHFTSFTQASWNIEFCKLIVLKQIEKYLFRIKTVTVLLVLKHQWTLNN